VPKVVCPACTSGDVGKLSSPSVSGYYYYICKGCELVFSEPMKGAGKEWYERSEWYDLPEEVLENLRWYERTIIHEDFLFGKKRVLNVGCGRNIFLKKLKEMNCEVTAVDISERVIEFTRNTLGIKDAHVGDILEFMKHYGRGKFDVIVSFEVLEHLEDPGTFMRRLKDLMNEDGRTVLSVPNRERIMPSKDVWDYPPHHLTRWNVRCLRNLLEGSGFLVEKIVVSPLSAEDLLAVFRLYFGTRFLENRIKGGDRSSLVAFAFRALFKLRVVFYNILAVIGRSFTRTKGLNIYAVARLKAP
jgi:SAM-dependent methyltransferase